MKDEQQKRDANLSDRFSKWRKDPAGFIEHELMGFAWSKQREICQSIVDNRYTAVKSCHDVGKTAIAGRIGAWWLSVHDPGQAFLVTSAPTGDQVKALLWREINKVHRAGRLPGRTNQTEWIMPPNELVGFGRAVRDTDPTAFQGIHAAHVLVIFDEACGMNLAIWEAAETLVANEDSRFLAIGNPDVPGSAFHEACKPGSGYNVIRISAFDSPNFTDEDVPDWLRPLLVSKTWVKERRKKWGEQSPLWKSKVEGEFPDTASDGLIPLSALNDARNRVMQPGLPNELGVDVARFGDDATTIYHRRGSVAHRVGRLLGRSTMETVAMVVKLANEYGASSIKIDDTGVGGGVTDRLNELRIEGKLKALVVPVIVGSTRMNDDDGMRFLNVRAKLNWEMRERFITGDICLLPPADGDAEDLDDLLADASSMKYIPLSNGKVAIEPKADMKKRLRRSPDDWDGFVLAFAPLDVGGDLVLPFSATTILVDPLRIPSHWPQVCAISIEGSTFAALWGAFDRGKDTLYLTGEYVAPFTNLAIHVEAVRARGKWIPVMFNHRADGRSQEDGVKLSYRMHDLSLVISTVVNDTDAGIREAASRMSTQRLKVFTPLQRWYAELLKFRRNEDYEILEGNNPLMHCMAMLCQFGEQGAITENRASSDERGYDPEDPFIQGAARRGNASTGY